MVQESKDVQDRTCNEKVKKLMVVSREKEGSREERTEKRAKAKEKRWAGRRNLVYDTERTCTRGEVP